jgi:4'-phosphopantetheinyl transferase
LKVLRTGLRRDTRSVEVEFRVGSAGGWNELLVRSVEGDMFPGWWRPTGSFVVTFAAARSTAPPQTLADPDPLDTAVPTHSWMDEPLRGSPATHP